MSTSDFERKPSQFTTSVKPTTSFLQTRAFAPPQTDESAPPPQYKYSENILEKLINQPSTQSSDTRIQARPRDPLRAIAKERMAIQAKLNIGEPNDKYEKEADVTAARVVQQINSPSQELGERQKLQMKPMKPLLQRRKDIAKGEASSDLESSIQSARGHGQSLDPHLQSKMGQAMGADFSGVRVHTDAKADQLNKSIQAKAFTTGQDVFFRQGAYENGRRWGQELIDDYMTIEEHKKDQTQLIQRTEIDGGEHGKIRTISELKKEIQDLINDGEKREDIEDLIKKWYLCNPNEEEKAQALETNRQGRFYEENLQSFIKKEDIEKTIIYQSTDDQTDNQLAQKKGGMCFSTETEMNNIRIPYRELDVVLHIHWEVMLGEAKLITKNRTAKIKKKEEKKQVGKGIRIGGLSVTNIMNNIKTEAVFINYTKELSDVLSQKKSEPLPNQWGTEINSNNSTSPISGKTPIEKGSGETPIEEEKKANE